MPAPQYELETSCADMTEQASSTRVIPVQAGIQFAVNAFAICSKSPTRAVTPPGPNPVR